MAAITVTFTPLPAHVRIARLVAVATARRAGVEDDCIDEVRFAVGEACSRAVVINAPTGDAVVMTMTDSVGSFNVEVRDCGAIPDTLDIDGGIDSLDLRALLDASSSADPGSANEPLPSEFGLAVISGLVESIEVTQLPDATSVSLTWPTVSKAVSAAH